MKTLTATVTAIAFSGLALPGLQALELNGKDLTIDPGLLIQVRGEASQAQDNAHNAYDVTVGGPGGATPAFARQSDDFDFYLRRCRLILKGTYDHDWGYNLTLQADRADQVPIDAAGTTSSRTVGVNQAYVTRSLPTGKFTSRFQAGLDYAFFNRANLGPSPFELMPNERATAGMLRVRGTGIGYRAILPWLVVGADIQNNLNDDAAATPPTRGKKEGMCYTARAEFTLPGEWAMDLGKYQESFAGANGKGLMIGTEVGYNHQDVPAGFNYQTDTLVVGADALLHLDGLSALTEVRYQRQENHNQPVPIANNVNGLIYLVQAGYAFPVTNFVLEPVGRLTFIDLDRDNNHEVAPFGAQDFGASGNQIEVGVNLYFDGHKSKAGAVVTFWQAEDGDADATIFRVQYQLYF